MLTSRPRTLGVLVCSLTLAVSALTVGTAAGGAPRTAKFCSDVTSAGVVLSPTLPTSDSLRAISKAVALLPHDVAALHKEHTRLLAASASAPTAATSSLLRNAATNVAAEAAALNGVIAQELTVALDPSSVAVMGLARRLIAATSSAASANTYLAVEHSLGPKTCA